MATINLGAIKFNWKGAYNSSTSYAVDDVVSSGGNSYVCIQAHSNQAVGNATAYWNIMSSAGTNGTDGTDLTSTLTAQGDIVYRDGSGLAKLGAGTSGQFLKTQGASANPVWANASSEAGKYPFHAYQNTQSSALGQSTNTEFVFNAEWYDPNSKYDTSTGRYTPGETGFYYVNAGFTINDFTGGADYVYPKLLVNGNQSNQYGQGQDGGATAKARIFTTTSAVIQLTNASDYISFWYYQTAGGNRYGLGSLCYFQGFKIA